MIVSNATLLITFSRIGRLDLLREVIGETLVIPEAVAAEIAGAPRASRGVIDLAREPWIRIESVRSRQQVELLLPSLDPGDLIGLVILIYYFQEPSRGSKIFGDGRSGSAASRRRSQGDSCTIGLRTNAKREPALRNAYWG